VLQIVMAMKSMSAQPGDEVHNHAHAPHCRLSSDCSLAFFQRTFHEWHSQKGNGERGHWAGADSEMIVILHVTGGGIG
jgi:hypothetical protein